MKAQNARRYQLSKVVPANRSCYYSVQCLVEHTSTKKRKVLAEHEEITPGTSGRSAWDEKLKPYSVTTGVSLITSPQHPSSIIRSEPEITSSPRLKANATQQADETEVALPSSGDEGEEVWEENDSDDEQQSTKQVASKRLVQAYLSIQCRFHLTCIT